MILFGVLVGMGGLAAVVPVITRWLGRDTGYVLAAGFLALIGVLTPAVATVPDQDVIEAELPWLPIFGVTATVRLDGLSAVFVLLVLGVGALIMAYCPRYLSVGRHTRTYVLLTLFAAAMLGLVLAADLVLLFVFWELTTIASFFLIGGSGAHSARAATRALVITFGGGLALLAAVVLIIVETGTSYLPDILAQPELILDSPMIWPVGLLLVLAAFTKSAQLPFHAWLPGAMVAITPVSAYLHAATMVKAGIYLLMRFTPVYGGQVAWQAGLLIIGLATAIFGAALALRQHDLKALLAYSTVSQLGLLVAVTGVGTPHALTAAVAHTVAHALFKATLFMLVGIIDREAGSRDVRELSGLRRVMPVTAFLTALAALSMAGVPPMIGFVSKESLFQGLGEADVTSWAGPVAAGAGVAASILTFAYSVRIFRGAFAGPLMQRQLYEPHWQFLAPAAVPAVAGLVLGPGVAVLNPLTISAVLDMAPGVVVPPLVFWHGLSPELFLSAFTIAAGLLLFTVRGRMDRLLQAAPSTPEGMLFDRGFAGAHRLAGWLTRPGDARTPVSHLTGPVVGLVGLAVGALVAADRLPTPAPGTSRALDWPVLVLLVVATIGAALARRVLLALILLGLVGITVSAWFALAGAPDVALTLLLVEVLTAVAAVLAVRVMPDRFPAVPRQRSVVTAGLATVLGLVAAGGTLAFTGHRDRSRAGTYFLQFAEEETGGHNVVNTLLVDFRALDTLGETTVLGVAALGLVLLLRETARRDLPGDDPIVPGPPRQVSNRAVFQVTYRVLAPAMLTLSVYLFFRGHYAPGGGFIAALVAGIAVTFGWIAHGRVGGRVPIIRSLRAAPLVGGGLVLCLLVGLSASLRGEPFLTPTYTYLAGLPVSTSTLFDLGVYLVVLGLVVAVVDRLGGLGPAVAHRFTRPVEPANAGGAP